MSTTIAELLVRITGDNKDAKRALAETDALARKADGSTTKSAGGMSKAWGLAGKAALVATGAIGVGAIKAIGDATDLKEAINKASVTYGKYAKEVPGFSSSVASSLGMTRAAALDNAAGLAAMTQAMGATKGESAAMSTRLLKMSADLGSFHNADPTDMLDRLRAGLSGESEPLKKFGILISEARVKQEAARLGLKAHNGTLTDAQKLQARYSLILKDGAIANDDFTNTSGGLANQQRILKAQITDLSAQLGGALLPAASAVVGSFMALVAWGQANEGTVRLIIAAVAGLSAGILVVVGAIKAWAAYQAVLNAVMAANPLLLIIGLIAGLVVAFVVAYKSSEDFRNIVDGVFAAVKTIVTTFAGFFTSTLPRAFQTVKNWVTGNWPIIATIISGPFAPLVALATNAFGIRSALTGAFSSILTMVRGKMADVIGAITDLWDNARTAGQTLGQNVWNGISNGIAKVGQLGATLWTKVSGAISSTASSALSGAAAIGRAIADGIISGIGDLAGRLTSKLVSPVTSAYNRVKDFIGSRSPSKMFARGIGQPIAQGIEMGIADESGRGGIARALKAAVPVPTSVPIPSALRGAAGVAGGRSGASGGLQVTILVQGNTMLADSYETAERLSRIVEPHLRRLITI